MIRSKNLINSEIEDKLINPGKIIKLRENLAFTTPVNIK